jgi:hypothetical protein
MTKELPIGISGGAVIHTDAAVPDVDTVFRMVSESAAFDYIERTPPTGLLDAFQRASAKYNIPLRSGGFFYTLGRDEPLLEWHLRIGRELGMRVQNVQITARDATGARVTDAQVAEAYLAANELGEKLGVLPCFEVHINMWSEQFSRVARVAELVEKRGATFRMTLDHSHVIFKIGNEPELDIENLREDLAAGLVLDPALPNNICGQWIQANWVAHAHARPAIPNNPPNIWAAHPDGRPRPGVQYPFFQPRPGDYHAPWDKTRREPWKQVLRHLFAHHASDPASPLGQVTLEMIPGIDYGAGHRYSIFDHNVACAKWLRCEWQRINA